MWLFMILYLFYMWVGLFYLWYIADTWNVKYFVLTTIIALNYNIDHWPPHAWRAFTFSTPPQCLNQVLPHTHTNTVFGVVVLRWLTVREGCWCKSLPVGSRGRKNESRVRHTVCSDFISLFALRGLKDCAQSKEVNWIHFTLMNYSV